MSDNTGGEEGGRLGAKVGALESEKTSRGRQGAGDESD